jgi:hypothetical protein
MYNYILLFLVIILLFFLITNKITFYKKEDFNSNLNGNIVILNRLIKTIADNKKNTRLKELITLDSIDI